jgi:head-tail adaptor
LIPAGQRDTRVAIMRQSTSRDSLGAPVETWSQIAWAMASRKPVMDGERLRALEVAADRTDRFVVPWSNTFATIDAKDRLRIVDYGGNTVDFDIVGVKALGRRQQIEITANARAEVS